MIDFTTFQAFTWAQIAQCAQQAMVSAALGGGMLRYPDGREIQRVSLKEATDLYNMAIMQMNAECAGPNGNNVLAVFPESQPNLCDGFNNW